MRRILCISLLVAALPVAVAASLTPAQLAARAAQLRPRPDETRWMQIPWVRSIAEGVKIAQAEHRPIMLWNVDYEPLERC
jgi:hypothetical protein